MFNPILKNCLPQLPEGFRWKFDVHTSYEDILRLQKRAFFNMVWETVDSELVDKLDGESAVIDAAKLLFDKNFGSNNNSNFYGTSI